MPATESHGQQIARRRGPKCLTEAFRMGTWPPPSERTNFRAKGPRTLRGAKTLKEREVSRREQKSSPLESMTRGDYIKW